MKRIIAASMVLLAGPVLAAEYAQIKDEVAQDRAKATQRYCYNVFAARTSQKLAEKFPGTQMSKESYARAVTYIQEAEKYKTALALKAPFEETCPNEDKKVKDYQP